MRKHLLIIATLVVAVTPAAAAASAAGGRLSVRDARAAISREEREWHHGGPYDRDDTGGFTVLKCARGGPRTVYCKVYAPDLLFERACTYWQRARLLGHRVAVDPTVWTQVRCAGWSPDRDPGRGYHPEPDGDARPPR